MTLPLNKYNSIHKWNLRHWEKLGKCEFCGDTERKTDWSNISGKYYRDKDDWQELCRPCHWAYDAQCFDSVKGPKPKLTKSMVEELHAKYKQKGVTQAQLAKEYGLHRITVNKALAYKYIPRV